MSDQEKMREAFEKSALQLGFNVDRADDGDYLFIVTREGWLLWQASRAQADAEHKEEIEQQKERNALMKSNIQIVEAELQEEFANAQLCIEQKDAAFKSIYEWVSDHDKLRIDKALALSPSLLR